MTKRIVFTPRGGKYRRPQSADLRHLALMDFLLEDYEEIPAEVLNLLCAGDLPAERLRSRNQ